MMEERHGHSLVSLPPPITVPPLNLTSARLLLHDLANFGVGISSPNKCAVIFDNGMGLVEELSYEELNNAAEFVKNELLIRRMSGSETTNSFIGVKCNLGILYPVLVLGILKSGSAFYNVDPDRVQQSVEDGVKYFGMKFVVASIKDKPWKGVDKGVEIEIPLVLNAGMMLRFKLFRICGGGDSRNIPLEIPLGIGQFAYGIQTSGSTGRKTSVLVPHSCICPNIVDLARNLWNVTGKDVIFGAAPPTFDPHIVELFTALMGGACIFYTTPEVKQNPLLLASLLVLHQVTILQITPSLFRRLSNFISLPSCKSMSLRLITLGGEKCPEKQELRKFQNAFSGRKVIFQNIYGVTEVSCWASLETVDLDTPDPITIGQGLQDTEVTLEPESNEILIKSSTRRCIIVDPTQSAKCLKTIGPEYRTGDLGTLSKNGIVFLGRKDRVVKRNGMKVSLLQIEQMTLSTGLVTFAQCKLHEGKIYLVTRLKDEYSSVDGRNKGENLIGGKLELPLFMYPDHLIVLKDVSHIPVNGNGKMDLTSICSKFHNKNLKIKQNTKVPWNLSNDRHEVVETLAPIWKSCTSEHRKQVEDILCQDNFTASGGTSISAVRFIESVFMALKLFGSEIHQKWEQALFTTLINGNFGDIVELIYKILLETVQSANFVSVSEDIFTSDLLPETQESLLFDNFQKSITRDQFEYHLIQDENMDSSMFTSVEEFPPLPFNSLQVLPKLVSSLQTHRFQLGLCVDASPVIVPSHLLKSSQQLVIVGCHGGVLLCVDLQTLSIAWKQRLPNRIEASVEIHPNSLYAYICCHDGKLYKVSVLTGQILCWYSGTTRDEADSSPIRSKCAVFCDGDDDIVIFIDSTNSIYCVDAHALNFIWTLRNSFRFLATVSPVIWRGRCYLATLDRGIVCLDIRRGGGTIWVSSTLDQDKSELIYYYYTPLIYKSGKKTVLICGFTQGMEVRDPKNGALLWRQMCSKTRVQVPLVNNCCGNLIWVEKNWDSSAWKGKILEVPSGKALKEFEVPFNSQNGGPIMASVVAQGECFLVYKSSCGSSPQITFINVHDDMHHRNIAIDKSIPDFETFSTPVCWNEFVLFGGRDNYLYVIQLLN